MGFLSLTSKGAGSEIQFLAMLTLPSLVAGGEGGEQRGDFLFGSYQLCFSLNSLPLIFQISFTAETYLKMRNTRRVYDINSYLSRWRLN